MPSLKLLSLFLADIPHERENYVVKKHANQKGIPMAVSLWMNSLHCFKFNQSATNGVCVSLFISCHMLLVDAPFFNF